MSDDFDADAFASEATGETTTDAHAAAEGTEASSDVGSTSTLREMLLSTDPAQSLEECENPWDPERGGPTRIYRGLMKATDVDGMPAIADVIIGVVETTQDIDFEDAVDGDQDDDQEDVDFA